MELTSLNVSLPRSMKIFIEDQVAKGHYSTPSEYVRALVRAAQRKQATPGLTTDDVMAIKNLLAADSPKQAARNGRRRKAVSR
jgi:putative addiction module CopG family antidote